MIRNIRDLGGIRTAAGRMIKPGMLIRSGNLSQAEEHELAGISTVIDLRTSAERSERPDRLYGREYLLLPVFEEITAGISHEKGAEDNGVPDMRDLYRWLPAEHGDDFRRILRAVMEHDYSTGAVLWHCSEGKDRGGLTAALILEILGADRGTIMEDYLKTNIVSLPKAEGVREQLRATRGEDFAESIFRALIADPSYLEAAWSVMGDGYPERIGLSDDDIAAFREKVLE
ncbi:MAG: tyrosine-protein phosphatase [Firmicutes bacterium]|nr:tyrosine-protein phosphatase [Bacillota bacterium]